MKKVQKELNELYAGQRWECFLDWVMDDGSIAYTTGKTYRISSVYDSKDDLISFDMPSNHLEIHEMFLNPEFLGHFRMSK